jgi:hypothetical protein
MQHFVGERVRAIVLVGMRGARWALLRRRGARVRVMMVSGGVGVPGGAGGRGALICRPRTRRLRMRVR